MVGILVVTHGNIGKEMVNAVRRILPDATHLMGVAVESNDPPARLREQVNQEIDKIQGSEGVLLLTDMFGGTPSNICLSFLRSPNIEVISGVNLPMLIKLASMRQRMPFHELVSFVQQYGQRNIVVASRVLDGHMQ